MDIAVLTLKSVTLSENAEKSIGVSNTFPGVPKTKLKTKLRSLLT